MVKKLSKIFCRDKDLDVIEGHEYDAESSHIVLIVGHTAKRTGAYSRSLGQSEYYYMSRFCQQLKEEIERVGGTCDVLYRDGRGIVATYKQALELNPSMILEWHFNSFSKPTARGFEILYKKDIDAEIRLMNSILGVFSAHLSSPNRGQKEKASKGERGFLNVAQTSSVPSLLIEPFFGSSAKDALGFEDKRSQIIKALAETLIQFDATDGVV